MVYSYSRIVCVQWIREMKCYTQMNEWHKNKSDTKDYILTYIHMSVYVCIQDVNYIFKDVNF